MKRTHALLALLLAVGTTSGAAQTKLTPEQTAAKADQLVRQMTLEEKIDYIGGLNEFYVRAVPRLGIPELKMADGPAGVRNYGHSTAYPTGIGLAATWDTAVVERVGQMMGKDSRARGVHFLLGPGVNIYRAPMCGRNFEYFGEDPFLASRMAVADIKGIQSQGVIATVKHYAANNQEWDRHRVSSDVDERTLREIYLPAFEASVRDAQVGAVMDSYNLVNGEHATQNFWLNTQVLRKDWGFNGVLMSDWNSVYDGVAAALSGLDLEMPDGKYMNRATLLDAVHSGRVPEAVIDAKVRNILSTALRFGFFDRPQEDRRIPLDNPEARKVALEAARESIVLLKNDGVLPLDAKKIKTLAVIGPDATPAAYGGGGSGLVRPFSVVSNLDGVRKLAGKNVKIQYAPGVPLVRATFKNTPFTTEASGGEPGLRAEYFANVDLKGTPAVTRVDPHVAFDYNDTSYAPGASRENFSARWVGYFTPKTSEDYIFHLSGDDGFRLWVDDKQIVDQWIYQGETLVERTLKLEAGHAYKIRLEYFQGGGGAAIGFGISDARKPELEEARKLAQQAEMVLLCIGFTDVTEGEGSDRTFAVSAEQQQLIDAVLAANRNVVVLVNAGGNIDMSQFNAKARAIVHAFYPGQEGGTAAAEVLFGKVNPSGKLPISLEREWKDSAAFNSYYDKDGSKRVAYTEGIFLGYRHYDRSAVKPLYPFGYGLSYTTFRYSGLRVSDPAADGTVTVRFSVTNTGTREGAEVAQLYVGDNHAPVARPVKELKGFARLALKPGESREATLTLDRRAFSYYDMDKHAWTLAPGVFQILVGSSSENIELEGKIELH